MKIQVGIDKVPGLYDPRLVIDNVDLSTIPEPATMLLLGLGGLLIRRKRR